MANQSLDEMVKAYCKKVGVSEVDFQKKCLPLLEEFFKVLSDSHMPRSSGEFTKEMAEPNGRTLAQKLIREGC